MEGVVCAWLRNDLRVHDNGVLHQATGMNIMISGLEILVMSGIEWYILVLPGSVIIRDRCPYRPKSQKGFPCSPPHASLPSESGGQ